MNTEVFEYPANELYPPWMKGRELPEREQKISFWQGRIREFIQGHGWSPSLAELLTGKPLAEECAIVIPSITPEDAEILGKALDIEAYCYRSAADQLSKLRESLKQEEYSK